MDANPVREILGRPLRLAVIGGGPGSFIGAMHRTAARLDGRYEIVAGVLSTDPDSSRAAAAAEGISTDRAYDDAIEMLSTECAGACQYHFHKLLRYLLFSRTRWPTAVFDAGT